MLMCMSSCFQVVPGASRVYVDREELSLSVIKQHKVLVQGMAHKDHILKSYIFRNADKLGQTIIFVRTRAAAESLYSVCPC
jgi:ATP-dependent RNA helicase DDX19/DBP5